MEYRLQHPDLDDWLVLAKGYKPAKAPKPPPKTTTPETEVASSPKPPTTRRTRTRSEDPFGWVGQAYDLPGAIERSLGVLDRAT